MSSLRIVAILVLVLGGCETRSSKFCAQNPDDSACGGGSGTDSGSGGCDPACAGMAPICNDQNVCVQCITNGDCTQTDHPVCVDATAGKVCHECRTSADCPDSDACMPDGHCEDATNVAYVAPAPAGDDAHTCAKDSPCVTVMHAATVKPIVVVDGENKEDIVATGKLTILGGPGAKLSGATDIPVHVMGAPADITLVNLDIGGASSTTIVNAYCIDQSDGKLTIDRVLVHFCSDGGINVEKGFFTASRATIRDNLNGGIAMGNNVMHYDITNAFLINNGTSTATAGAVSLKASMPSRFEFNTVGFNQNASGGDAAGVQCAGTQSVPNNIIVQNVHPNGTTPTLADTGQPAGANCTFTDSIFGLQNVMELKFGNINPPYDLTLTTGSTAVNAATSTSVDIDNKGLFRPQGNAPDKGADELEE